MKKEIVAKLNMRFEEAAYQEDDIEYWLARDLQVLLNYTKWSNFLQVIEKAKTTCETSDQNISDHFADVGKTINMPKGATKRIADIMLTRYACYLIAQNGDPRKEQIAFAQSYFAIQTRKQELLEERIEVIERLQAREKLTTTEKEFSKLIYERGVDNLGFGRIRSKGDRALFGGHTTMNMKNDFFTKNRVKTALRVGLAIYFFTKSTIYLQDACTRELLKSHDLSRGGVVGA